MQFHGSSSMSYSVSVAAATDAHESVGTSNLISNKSSFFPSRKEAFGSHCESPESDADTESTTATVEGRALEDRTSDSGHGEQDDHPINVMQWHAVGARVSAALNAHTEKEIDVNGWHAAGARVTAALSAQTEEEIDVNEWHAVGARVTVALNVQAEEDIDVHAWRSVGARIAAALRREDFITEAGGCHCESPGSDADTESTTATDEGSALEDCTSGSDHDEQDDYQVNVMQWHAVGARVSAAVNAQTEEEIDVNEWQAVGTRVTGALNGQAEEDIDVHAWQSVGSRIAAALRREEFITTSMLSVGRQSMLE